MSLLIKDLFPLFVVFLQTHRGRQVEKEMMSSVTSTIQSPTTIFPKASNKRKERTKEKHKTEDRKWKLKTKNPNHDLFGTFIFNSSIFERPEEVTQYSISPEKTKDDEKNSRRKQLSYFSRWRKTIWVQLATALGSPHPRVGNRFFREYNASRLVFILVI